MKIIHHDVATNERTEKELTNDEATSFTISEIDQQAATQIRIKEGRRDAFMMEADPLFFGWQRGENTEQEWLDKVAEIRARYPYPA